MSEDKVSKSVAEAIAAQQSGAKLPRRFYKDVSVAAKDIDGGAGFVVLLDGRALRSPGKTQLALPSEVLAARIAQEWQRQETQIDLAAMPLTRLAYRAIDLVQGNQAETRREIVKYASSDLLCYRADQPQELIARQALLWDPVLAWANEVHEIDLNVATGIVPVRQSDAALGALDTKIASAYGDPFLLAALHVLTTLSGSALLAFAHGQGQLSAGACWDAAHVDEDWQIEKWGEDDEAVKARAARRSEFDTASEVLKLLR